jgi:branched-chain amino acid transport system permease protein
MTADATKTSPPGAPKAPTIDPKDLTLKISGGLIIAGLVVWLGFNFHHSPAQFLTVAIDGLKNGALYAMIALGYTMVYGIIQLINFAHGDLFMLGTMMSAFVITTVLGQNSPSLAGYGAFAVALVVSMTFCGTVNIGIERFAYRRLRRAPKLAPLITAVGMSFVLQFIGLRWNGSGQHQWQTVLPDTKIDLGGVLIDVKTVIIFAVTIPILAALTWLVTKTKQGRAMRATAQDQDAARLMGINVDRTISFTFGLGGALAGAAGLMYQQVVGTTAYNLGFQLGLIAFTSAVLGGIGNLSGAVLGGLLIGLIQGLNDGLTYGLGQQWSQSVVFTILILLMVFKPAGLLGKSVTEKV